MNFSNATTQQLLTVIAEKCPIAYKYKAAFELEKRKEQEKSREVSRYKHLAAFSDKTYSVKKGSI